MAREYLDEAGSIFNKDFLLEKVESVFCKILEGSVASNAPDSDTLKHGLYATELFWVPYKISPDVGAYVPKCPHDFYELSQ